MTPGGVWAGHCESVVGRPEHGFAAKPAVISSVRHSPAVRGFRGHFGAGTRWRGCEKSLLIYCANPGQWTGTVSGPFGPSDIGGCARARERRMRDRRDLIDPGFGHSGSELLCVRIVFFEPISKLVCHGHTGRL